MVDRVLNCILQSLQFLYNNRIRRAGYITSLKSTLVSFLFSEIKTYRYHIKCVRRVSGIAFIRYAQSQKIGKPNNYKIKPKGLQRIANIHDFDHSGLFASRGVNTIQTLLVIATCIYRLLVFLSVSKVQMYFQTMDIYMYCI
jgi:hypothetical protein